MVAPHSIRVAPSWFSTAARLGWVWVRGCGRPTAWGSVSSAAPGAVPMRARLRPLVGGWAANPQDWLWKNSAKAARSWSVTEMGVGAVVCGSVEGSAGSAASGGSSRVAVGHAAAWSLRPLGRSAARGSEVSWFAAGRLVAAAYGVGFNARSCIALRAECVVASGARAPVGHVRKCGPASSRVGRRGAPWRLGCRSPRSAGSGAGTPAACRRRQR